MYVLCFKCRFFFFFGFVVYLHLFSVACWNISLNIPVGSCWNSLYHKQQCVNTFAMGDPALSSAVPYKSHKNPVGHRYCINWCNKKLLFANDEPYLVINVLENCPFQRTCERYLADINTSSTITTNANQSVLEKEWSPFQLCHYWWQDGL